MKCQSYFLGKIRKGDNLYMKCQIPFPAENKKKISSVSHLLN